MFQLLRNGRNDNLLHKEVRPAVMMKGGHGLRPSATSCGHLKSRVPCPRARFRNIVETGSVKDTLKWMCLAPRVARTTVVGQELVGCVMEEYSKDFQVKSSSHCSGTP